MVEFTGIAPVLPVRDVEQAVDHYRRLGFDVETYEGGGYAYVRRDEIWLHLTHVPELDPLVNTSSVYLYVDDAHAVAAAWDGCGGRLSPPAETPYGLLEGAYIDPDGNLLRFGSPIRRS